MEPINYLTNVPSPAGAVFQGLAQGTQQQQQQQQLAASQAQEQRAAELQPFAVQGAQLGLDQGRQGLQAQADQNARAGELHPLQVQAQQQQIAAQQQQQQRAQRFQSEAARLATLGPEMTLADLQGVVTEFPEYGQSVVGSFEAMNEAQRNSVSGVMAQAAFALKHGNTAAADTLIDEYAAAAEASGNDEIAATARAIQQTAEINPNAALMSLGLALQTIAPDAAAQIFDAGTSARVQSTVSVGPTLSVQTMSNGDTRVVDTATNTVLTGQEAQDAISQARGAEADFARNITQGRREGTLEADIELGGEAAATVKAAGIAQDKGLEAFERVGIIREQNGTLDQVVAAIDAGANTGQIASRFPAWNAATTELRNLQSQLGLNVISSVTFGALSEGELRLALSTALPAKLDQAALRQWVIDKKSANDKLAGYMEEQARFLSRPGNTISDWLDKVDAGPQGQAVQPQPAAPQAAAPVVPSYLLQFGGQ